MAALSAKPELNPELTSFFSGLFARTKTAVVASGSSTAIYVVLAILVLFGIGMLIYYYRSTRMLETQANITRVAQTSAKSYSAYDVANPKRKGLRDYLKGLKQSGVPDTHLSLTNFYIATVNAAGIFLPAKDNTVSQAAIRSAVLGGARAFVFDIWPDLTPGAQFAPIIQAVEAGSQWRRISLNSGTFISLLRTLVQEALEVEGRPGYEDPLMLYLRFRGTPRPQTYTGTANALRAVIEPYRLGAAYNNCRAQDRIFTTPIVNLLKKIIVVSNVRADGNLLSDFINVGPRDGVKLEWAPREANGLSEEARRDAIRKIQQNLCFVAPATTDPDTENNYDFKIAQSIGVHFTAMNYWNDNDTLKEYMKPDMFGVQSFKIKPESLRYVIEVLPAPRVPQDPKWGSGPTAGSPTLPPSLRLP